ncbi:MAG TPA: alpha-L-arabinofuranosidase C-terminal domain-containing protein [Parafilimonas sp.]|nr:alpha-L-arabinofuranosidase C-terminal domain-containing protein [Parafilimonas sp.]
MIKRYVSPVVLVVFSFIELHAQPLASKPISPDLFGIFFEDISYAADGGLYAELIQNRSFEYNPGDKDAWAQNRRSWDAFTSWEYTTKGYGYGDISLETTSPLNNNNPHYLVINVEEPGSDGVGITNYGFDGIVIKKGEQYNFSAFIRNLSGNALSFEIKLLGKRGDTMALQSFSANSPDWKKYTAAFTPSIGDDSSSFAILCKTKGKFAIDMVSLFPQNTFRNEPNGLRADLAQTIADLHPKFVRFPGGCLVHGDGLGNMYRWKNTIGPVEERVEQKNIWSYHQTVGLGFYEYFRFCEDIGAKPLPIVAAAVSCQNSGGTWRVGGTGQKAVPLNEMPQYIQDVLDLIEYANGPATSPWGAKRAAAGHPASFNLQYIGVGNEDKQTDDFRERFKLIYDAVKAGYPDIIVVGTAGPFYKGEDFDLGWQFANKLNVPVVDEHYYEKPEWFLGNQNRYDNYDRKKSKVYAGEYASRGNSFYNALAEAAYMISLERNGDVVVMASYAPLLANKNHISWSPDLIYFNNTTVAPSINYYVQQLFSVHAGNRYYSNVISFNKNDSTLAASCVTDANGDVILKIVNAGSSGCKASINLKNFRSKNKEADGVMLTGKPDEQNTFQSPETIIPKNFKMNVTKSFIYDVAAYSFTVIRIKK